MYDRLSWFKDCMAISNRANAVLLARLRAGHTPLLKAYANVLDPSAGPPCPLCKDSRRQPKAGYGGAQGSPPPPLKVLTTNPERVLALAWVTLWLTFGDEASTITTTMTAGVGGSHQASIPNPSFGNNRLPTTKPYHTSA